MEICILITLQKNNMLLFTKLDNVPNNFGLKPRDICK